MAQAADLTVYGALDQKTMLEVIRVFEKQTGLDVELGLQMEQAGTLASRVEAEAKEPRADVLIGGNSNIHARLAKRGLLHAYRSPMVEEAGIDIKFMDPQGYWSGWYLGAVCKTTPGAALFPSHFVQGPDDKALSGRLPAIRTSDIDGVLPKAQQ